MYIKSEWDAAKHIPKCPTLVVRLEGSEELPCRPLQDSSLYTVLDYGPVPEYHLDAFLSPQVLYPTIHDCGNDQSRIEARQDVLDNLEECVRRGNLFDVGLARRMIIDFEKQYRSVDALLVHCAFGACRAPTYALAMNDLFDLGFDSVWLRQRYKLISWHMYRTIMDVGSTIVNREEAQV